MQTHRKANPRRFDHRIATASTPGASPFFKEGELTRQVEVDSQGPAEATATRSRITKF
ncbi:hypothetical protein [Lysobacter gummosus]|uniref:hypothetical protein n=1 Tax=Lysobacter gummosus TaxID=262324 RepID=UPI003626BB26